MVSKIFDLIEGRYLENTDLFDGKYVAWSRAYEYPQVMDYLNKWYFGKQIEIHNTSCGGHDNDHIHFLQELEKNPNWTILNSDIDNTVYENHKKNNLNSEFEFYDITKKYLPFSKQFDVIINISTIEEIPNIDYKKYFENIWNQLKTGGELIITLDTPPAQLNDLFNALGYFEVFHNSVITENALSYNNTKVENPPDCFGNNFYMADHCHIYFLILKKGE